MKLDRDSVISRLYRWFYNTEQMPMSICPYFWKLVFMWLVIVPYFIFVLPSFIIERMSKNFSYPHNNAERRVTSVASWYGLFMIFCTGTAIYSFFIKSLFKTEYEGFVIIGHAGIMLIAIILLGYFGYVIYKKLTHKPYIPYSERIPKKDSIIKSFFKAKKEKYCPKIDWE